MSRPDRESAGSRAAGIMLREGAMERLGRALRGVACVASVAAVSLAGGPVAAQGTEDAIEVPMVDAGQGLGTPGGEALARLGSGREGALDAEMLAEAMKELELMIEEAEKVAVLGVTGVDSFLEGTLEVPRGEERLRYLEDINARLSVLDDFVSIAERLQEAESRLGAVRDSALQTRVDNIQRVVDVVQQAKRARELIGEGGGGVIVQPNEVEIDRSSGRQRFRIVGTGAVADVSVNIEGMAGVVVEQEDCEGVDLSVVGECRVIVGWSGVRTDFPDTAELVVGGLQGDGSRVYGRAIIATGRGGGRADSGGFSFVPSVLEIDTVSGERAVTVRAEEGVVGGIALEVVGFRELGIASNACAEMTLQAGESCLVVLQWEGARPGTGTGTIVATGVSEEQRRLVSVATVGRQLEGGGAGGAVRAGVEVEPEELAVDSLAGAATVRIQAEGEIAEAGFEIVGGGGLFSLDEGNCAVMPLRDGDMCVMTVAWTDLDGPENAHGEVVIRGVDAGGARIGGSVPIRPGRVLSTQVREEVERRLTDAEERARIAEERLELGPSVVGDPDVGLGTVFPEESAILLDDEYAARVAAEAEGDQSEEMVALLAEQELLRAQLEALMAERGRQARSPAEGFDEQAFMRRERDRLAEYENRIERRLRVLAAVDGNEEGADVQLFGWPPEVGVTRLWLQKESVLEGRWTVRGVDGANGSVWVYDAVAGKLVEVPFGERDAGWWLPHARAGRLISPEGLQELREEGRLAE